MNKKTKDGYGKVLGSLEQEIMDLLWSLGSASGKEVFGLIKSTRGIALTTVLTVLERLWKKGLVTKVKGESVYIFRPSYTKDDFARKVSRETLKGLFEISVSGASASFVDMLSESDPDELDRLSALIKAKKERLKAKGS